MDQTQNIAFKPIIISEHYALINSFMEGLHESEKELFDQTEDWNKIEKSYMQHVIETQEECNGTCLVAYVDNVPAGFIFGYEEEQDDSRIEKYEGIELYISDGYIAPEFRRLGLYKKLNEAMEQTYIQKGVHRILRYTLNSNVRMQRFLEGQGYKVVRLQYEKWLEPDGKTIKEIQLTEPK